MLIKKLRLHSSINGEELSLLKNAGKDIKWMG